LNTEYEILTQVRFNHRFFSSNKLECLTIKADANTEQLILKLGLLFKPFSNGFLILYSAFNHDEKIDREKILDNTILRFQLTLNDPYFFNYTNGDIKNGASSFYYFENNSNQQKTFSNQNLHKEEYVSAIDTVNINEFDQSFFKKPFGVIDIQLHNDLQANYYINFKEKESYWRYIIMSDHLKKLQQPAIIGNSEVFEGPTNVTLPNNQEAVSFVSVRPIRLKQRPDQYFKLVDHYKEEESTFNVLINALPVPDTRHMPLIIKNKNDEKYYSEIFIY
jgi:hypothetical protein